MTIFSKFTKSSHNEKSIYPWSQRKLSGSSNALPRFGHCASIFDNQRFYIYGGIHNKGNAKKNMFLVDTNNLSASSVSTSGDIPSLRSFATLSTLGSFVLLYGGEPLIPGEIWDPHFYVLHTGTRQWSRVRTKGRLPSERAGHSTCISNNGIMYVWGGHYQRKYLNDLCAFNVKDYPAKAEWDFISYENQGPSPRSGHISVIYNDKLYIFGGISATHLYNDIWSFDLKTHIWTQIAAVGYIPSPREGCAAALINDTIYIFGGKGLNSTCLGDLCAFRIKNQRWYMFQSMGVPPSPRCNLSMTVIQNKIYVFGGDSMGGKPDDSGSIFILDCSKIRYPPEESIERGTIESNGNIRNINNPDSKPMIKVASQDSLIRSPQPSKSMLNFLSSTDQLINSYQQRSIHEDEKLNSPVKIDYIEKNQQLEKMPSVIPPRPPREGVTLDNRVPTSPTYNNVDSMEYKQVPISSVSHIPIIPKAANERAHESGESKRLSRELFSREVIIAEMKKKEQWWRTEVSIARHIRAEQGENLEENNDTKLAHLIPFKDNDPDKLLLFQQLVSAKTEIKKIRTSIQKQTEPILQKIEEAEKVRMIALEEAAYYKSKYTALKTRDNETLSLLESDRAKLLEERLEEAYAEKERIHQTLKSIRQHSEEDKNARFLAEENAREAQLQSEKAQEAHQIALDQLTELYDKILVTEAKGREDAKTIADLSSQLANQLSLVSTDETDISEIHIEMSRLEVANIKLRNEIASLLMALEESKDDEIHLRMVLSEKDQAYSEIANEIEKSCIEIELLKSASNNSHHHNLMDIATMPVQ